MNNIIKGTFLLLLAVCGNYIAETLSCKTQKYLKENMFLKHFIILIMVYFVINLMDDKIKHPSENLKITIAIYIIFLLFTKTNIYFTIFSFLILLIILIIENYKKYYKKNKNNKYKIMEKIQNYLIYLLITIITIGFFLYFIKQRNDHKKNWNTLKFIFGVVKCNSLK